MAKSKTVFYCTDCGNETPKWQGRCPACGAWNTIVEYEGKVTSGTIRPIGTKKDPQRIKDIDTNAETRFSTGNGELDRVLGGGAVVGSLVLVGGAPGIGKSTLLLQICNDLCAQRKVLYISGEESESQLKLRAQRIGVAPDNLFILSETNLSDILEMVNALEPDILIVDEVLSVGDYRFQEKCEERINKMIAHGTTVIIVSHDMDLIKKLCTQILWLEHGCKKAIGNVRDMCNKYQNE